jgi:hypothetical protein
VLTAVLSGLAFWPGLLLVVAGGAKARQTRRNDGISSTVVGRLMGKWLPLRPAWGLIAAIELAVGGLVLATAFTPWPEAAAALVLAAAAALAYVGLRKVPGADCGCFGIRKQIHPKTIVRAGLLAALAAAGAAGGEGWTAVFDHPLALVPLVAAGALLLWLSPELTDPVEELQAETVKRARWLRHSACRRRAGPVERTAEQLRRSDLWRRAQPFIAADAPSDHWLEGCTRVVCYPAVYEGEPATAVFAVAIGLRHDGTNVAFVNEDEQRVLARLEA